MREFLLSEGIAPERTEEFVVSFSRFNLELKQAFLEWWERMPVRDKPKEQRSWRISGCSKYPTYWGINPYSLMNCALPMSHPIEAFAILNEFYDNETSAITFLKKYVQQLDEREANLKTAAALNCPNHYSLEKYLLENKYPLFTAVDCVAQCFKLDADLFEALIRWWQDKKRFPTVPEVDGVNVDIIMRGTKPSATPLSAILTLQFFRDDPTASYSFFNEPVQKVLDRHAESPLEDEPQ